jgi:hypothetical protein
VPKQLRSAIVTAMAVLLAGVSLALHWSGVAIAALALALMVWFAAFARHRAESALPGRPEQWAYWIGHTEWMWIAAVVAVAAAALYFGVRFGDHLHESIAGTAALGAVAGVAFVKLLDELSAESDWIDERTCKLAKSTFQETYRAQFDNSVPPGPIPYRHAERPNEESDEFVAVYVDEQYGGWDAKGRQQRAKVISRYIRAHSNVRWIIADRNVVQ